MLTVKLVTAGVIAAAALSAVPRGGDTQPDRDVPQVVEQVYTVPTDIAVQARVEP